MSLAAASLFALVLASYAPEAPTERVAIASLALITEGIERDALIADLRLRAPEVEVLDAAASCGDGCLEVAVRRGADGSLAVEARLTDGRIFRRSLGAATEGERTAATTLAHLVEALAEGRPPPEDGASEPSPAPSEAPPSVVLEARPQATPPETAPDPGDATVELPTCPPAQSLATTEAPPSPPPRLEVGVALGIVATFGVGPPQGLAGRVGTGFAGALTLRTPRGALALLDLRSLQARESGHRLERVRIAAGGGYSLRRGRLELPMAAAVVVEPWWVVARADGGRASSGPPLLGGALSLAPSVGAALRDDLRARVGLRLEGAVSLHPREGGVLQATSPDGAPLFRLGGAELSALVEIGLAWGRDPAAKRAKGARSPRRRTGERP